MKTRKQTGTALLAAIFLSGAAVLVGSVIIYLINYQSQSLIRQANSDGLRQITIAVQYYAEINKESLLLSKRIIGFANPNAPTVEELQTIQYLTTDGVNITAPFGSSYRTAVIANGNGTITGFVYLMGNVVDKHGEPDSQQACNIARNLGDIGFCSVKNNGAFVGNSTVELPNPAGNQVATIAASIFVPN